MNPDPNRPLTYSEKLRDARWHLIRDAVKERDGYRCKECGGTYDLQVHHLYRIIGAAPWEYPESALVTLCDKHHHEAEEAAQYFQHQFQGRFHYAELEILGLCVKQISEDGMHPRKLYSALRFFLETLRRPDDGFKYIFKPRDAEEKKWMRAVMRRWGRAMAECSGDDVCEFLNLLEDGETHPHQTLKTVCDRIKRERRTGAAIAKLSKIGGRR